MQVEFSVDDEMKSPEAIQWLKDVSSMIEFEDNFQEIYFTELCTFGQVKVSQEFDGKKVRITVDKDWRL